MTKQRLAFELDEQIVKLRSGHTITLMADAHRIEGDTLVFLITLDDKPLREVKVCQIPTDLLAEGWDDEPTFRMDEDVRELAALAYARLQAAVPALEAAGFQEVNVLPAEGSSVSVATVELECELPSDPDSLLAVEITIDPARYGYSLRVALTRFAGNSLEVLAVFGDHRYRTRAGMEEAIPRLVDAAIVALSSRAG